MNFNQSKYISSLTKVYIRRDTAVFTGFEGGKFYLVRFFISTSKHNAILLWIWILGIHLPAIFQYLAFIIKNKIYIIMKTYYMAWAYLEI